MQNRPLFKVLKIGICPLLLLFCLSPQADAASLNALVVGNGDYHESPLKNPVNDAKDIAAHLQSLGFEVDLVLNADRRKMKEGIHHFAEKLQSEDQVGLFYYAGHGVEINGENYLIPVSADIRRESDVEFEAINAGRLLASMDLAGNGLNMVMAITANINGISPLLVSFEMSAEEQAARHDAYLAKVSHTGLMRGMSTKEEVDRLNRELRLRKNRAPFLLVEDIASTTTVSSLAAKIKQHSPGIVFVDGVYMMDDENGEPKGSPQALTNITRSLKRLAQQYKVPIIITTQVLSAKLSSRVSRRVTADAIGYSSSFVQDSDIVMSVEKDPDYEDRSIVRVLLSRTSPHGEVTIKWDWDNMDFTEVGEDDDDDDEDRDDFHDW